MHHQMINSSPEHEFQLSMQRDCFGEITWKLRFQVYKFQVLPVNGMVAELPFS